MFLAMFEKYQKIVLTMQISNVFLLKKTVIFLKKTIDINVFNDVLQNAKHQAYDASNDVNRHPRGLQFEIPSSADK